MRVNSGGSGGKRSSGACSGSCGGSERKATMPHLREQPWHDQDATEQQRARESGGKVPVPRHDLQERVSWERGRRQA